MKRVVFVFSLVVLLVALFAGAVVHAASSETAPEKAADNAAKAADSDHKADAAKTEEGSSEAAPAAKSSADLTEGEIEQQGYEKRAALVKDLKNRVKVVQDGLNKLAQNVKDDDLKSALVKEMQELADRASKAVDKLENASGDYWTELEKEVEEIMNKLDMFVQKLDKKV